MAEQEFACEQKEDGLCILRCYGSSGRVVVPQTIEGVPVTEISSYAFAEEKDEEPVFDSGFPCICGEALQELVLPPTIRRLGRYLFYNCTKFERFSFYSNIAYMGAGAFTGCGRLSELALHQVEGGSCLREILQDLRQKVAVECFRDGEMFCRLVYPEFFEEAVENTPARIISTQTHGMGIQYRNAFRSTQVIFAEYDRLFDTGKYNADITSVVEIAVSRLAYPYKLEEAARERYEGWLLEHLEEAAGWLSEQGGMKFLRFFAEEVVNQKEQMEPLLAAAKKKADAQALSMLMDIRHRRFAGKRRQFSL